MTTTTETPAEQLARLRAMPHFGLYPITLGSSWDVRDLNHVAVLDLLEAEGWTVERHERHIPADATVVCAARLTCMTPGPHRHPHTLAGATFTWGRAVPPAYDPAKDPAREGTARAIQRTGNSDGHGRTDFMAEDRATELGRKADA